MSDGHAWVVKAYYKCDAFTFTSQMSKIWECYFVDALLYLLSFQVVVAVTCHNKVSLIFSSCYQRQYSISMKSQKVTKCSRYSQIKSLSNYRTVLLLYFFLTFEFWSLVSDLSKLFNAKISIEHQLPTASKKLMITDECIVSALISLVTCTGKVGVHYVTWIYSFLTFTTLLKWVWSHLVIFCWGFFTIPTILL